MTEKILAKREKFFENIELMAEHEIEDLSKKWHDKMNRYQRFIASIIVRRFEKTGTLQYTTSGQIQTKQRRHF
jgi:hypothetical protein